MASSGQCEFIADLLERRGLTREEAADLSGEPSWLRYETLSVEDASEMIDWLKEHRGSD